VEARPRRETPLVFIRSDERKVSKNLVHIAKGKTVEVAVKRNPMITAMVVFAMVLALLPALAALNAPAARAATPVAWDMVNTTSSNLNSFTDDPAIPFTSAADGFQKFQRGVSGSIPFAVLDDSLSVFPPDSQGIIGEANTDEFFGVVDTNNGDTGGAPVTATWAFDVTGASDLSLSIDMGAMGDFEPTDSFAFAYAIDGGAASGVFSIAVDEADSQTYTLDGGAMFTLDDPLVADGVKLSNALQTITAPLTGTGSELVLTLTVVADSGSEAFAFQNLIINQGGGGGPVDPPFGVCGDAATLIHTIQGSGATSPEEGNKHVVEGVVVGDFQDTATELSGFFLQEEDGDADGDAATSEGIFVNDNGFADVDMGDVVRVKGEVDEAFGLTQLESITDLAECADQVGGASAASVTLPVAVDLEPYEGMGVNFAQTLYATDNFNWHRFGEVVLSVGGVLDNPTDVVPPGAPALALQDLNNRSQVQLDDGSSLSSSDPAFDPPSYISADGTMRRGDTVDGLTGALGYAFGAYEVHPTASVSFTRVNDRDPAPDVGGTIQVGAFNVLNYFTTIDNAGPICGPLFDQGCRGADSADEFTRQRDKIIDAIVELDAEVLGLMEIENAADNTPEADLVAGLNAVAGAGTYAYVETPGGVGNDAIRVSLLYQPGEVTLVGDFAILDTSVDPDFNDDKNRAVLAQTFEENATGEVFTVAVNHLKSKGSACDDVGDPDAGDLQGNCNGVRTAGAIAQANWLAGDPTGSGDPDFLITGDLNAYAQEDPIVALEDAGYNDLIQIFDGLDAYSFVFFGQGGYLDHAMATPSLTDKVTGATHWHINADEPRGLDYNLDANNQASLYNPDEWRASDHDPVLVGLDMENPMGMKEKAAGDLAAVLPTGNKQNDNRISKAIDAIEDSLDADLWADDSHLTKDGHRVFSEEKKAVQELKNVSGSAAGAAQAAIDLLLDADRRLAQAAIDVALATGDNQAKIDSALAALAAGDAESDPALAIDRYRKAWEDAVASIGEARFATYNASLNRNNAGDLARELSAPGSPQPSVIAEIIQRTRPEVLLVNEFDYDPAGTSAVLFQNNYLGVSQGGADPIEYPFRYSAESNTGIYSGFDLDNSGAAGDFVPNDSFGFGFFPGQFGMQVYSMHPLDMDDIRTFQKFLWKDMPGALLPENPPGTPWYSDDELDVFRLSSKSHWDVPVLVGDREVHFLVSHPTPPVFDGPEDRNGTRNHDEIRFWADYIDPSADGYIYDDNGETGGVGGGARFVIAGDQNSDPNDGDSIPGAAQLLLDSAKVNTSITPASLGGPEQSALQGGINTTHISDPAFDTADFSDSAPGNLRVDYVLPSNNITMVDAGVFWPLSTDPLFPLVGTVPFPSSDHKLVWIDIIA